MMPKGVNEITYSYLKEDGSPAFYEVWVDGIWHGQKETLEKAQRFMDYIIREGKNKKW
jgi:hypothetical protein